MNIFVLSIVILGTTCVPTSSFVVSTLNSISCEVYNATCVKEALASNGALDITQVVNSFNK